MLCKLNDIAIIKMGQSPSGKDLNSDGEGIPFLQGRKTFGRIYPTIDTWTTNPKKIGKKDSILLSLRAPVGDINIANQDICIGRGLCSIESKSNCLQEYLYYLLLFNKQQLKNKATGTTFEGINRDDLNNLKVEIPDLETQQKIVRILSALDQKIELNNQQLEVLVKTGKCVYDDYYKKSVESIKATEKLEFIKGVEPGSKSYKKEKGDGDIRFIRVGDMLSDTPENYVDKQLCSGFILLESDVAISFDATIGRVSYGISGGYSSGLRKVKSEDENISDAFIYYYLTSNDVQKTLFENATGTTILHAGKAINYFVLPYDSSIAVVSKKLSAIFSKQLSIKRQNNTLKNLRDTLLPKLMSGEIDLNKESGY